MITMLPPKLVTYLSPLQSQAVKQNVSHTHLTAQDVLARSSQSQIARLLEKYAKPAILPLEQNTSGKTGGSSKGSGGSGGTGKNTVPQQAKSKSDYKDKMIKDLEHQVYQQGMEIARLNRNAEIVEQALDSVAKNLVTVESAVENASQTVEESSNAVSESTMTFDP